MSISHEPCGDDWVEVTESDLPLSCPLSHQAVAHAHPRVYLPIEDRGKAKCYYCGTLYVLKDYAGSQCDVQ